MTIDEFFQERPASRALFDAVRSEVVALGPAEIQVTKSQIAFRRARGFAWAWVPEMHLRRELAPLVLSVALRRRDDSPRWKEVVEPRPGRFMHHLELRAEPEIDDEVRRWLREAWEEAE